MHVSRRRFLKTAGAGICLASAGGLRALAAAAAAKPNIILCMADDQGWGDVGYNGHPILKTPNLDAMAQASLRFDRFYAAAPVCSPTRGSVMTGRHPNRFGCFRWGYTLRPQEMTVAEALKTAGYVTGHFGKWHLGSVRKGSPVNPGASGFDEWCSAPNFFDNNPILSREGVAVQTRGESSIVTVDAALEFVRKHAKGPAPFLAVVWFGSPHSPHKASEEDAELYAGQDDAHRNFYGEVNGIDRAVGKLREALRALGIHENTILWYCSDNGGLPKVGSTGGRAQKGAIYEGGLRVPGLLEWPARLGGPGTTQVPCNTSDIYPTLLEIANVQMPNQPPLDGVSLVPLLDGTMTQRPHPMGFWQYPGRGISTPSGPLMKDLLKAQQAGGEPTDTSHLRLDAGDISKQYPEDRFPGHAAWLDWPWKLHRKPRKEQKEPAVELYNLADDPEEKTDVKAAQPDLVKAMRAALEAWQASVVRSLNGKDYR
ncbi:MAG: sulfatase-like hydrolase/transferase [Kiritimatiellae bacterium]|nr:sulfatase-like hydrolase/transferase [Kiritimatiellia bacterium]